MKLATKLTIATSLGTVVALSALGLRLYEARRELWEIDLEGRLTSMVDEYVEGFPARVDCGLEPMRVEHDSQGRDEAAGPDTLMISPVTGKDYDVFWTVTDCPKDDRANLPANAIGPEVPDGWYRIARDRLAGYVGPCLQPRFDVVSERNRGFVYLVRNECDRDNRPLREIITFVSVSFIDDQADSFLRGLAAEYAVFALLLFGLQQAVLQWMRRPIRMITGAIDDLLLGKTQKVETEHVLKEFLPLVESANRFLELARRWSKEAKEAHEDAAHSLRGNLGGLSMELAMLELPNEVRDRIGNYLRPVEEFLQEALDGRGRIEPLVPGQYAEIGKQTIRDVYSTFGPTRLRSGTPRLEVTCDTPEPYRVLLREADVLKMLGCLIDNAVKYGRMRVCVSVVGDGAMAVVTVEDDGRGVPDEERELVLARRARGTDAIGGHGIGLHIVQKTAKARGGSFELGASEIGGVKATLRLPMLRAE